MRHFPEERNFQKFPVFFEENVLRFLSLRYSADFRRSRLVFFFSLHSHSELSTFLTILTILKFLQFLANEVVFLHNLRNSTGPKGTPLEYFRLCETFFQKKFTKEFPFNFWIFSDRIDVEKS